MTHCQSLLLAAVATIVLATHAHAVLPASEECRRGQLDVTLSSIDMHTAELRWQLKASQQHGLTDADSAQMSAELRDFANRVDADLRKCKRGDMLSLPASEGRLVGEKCDFSKPIVRGGDDVMCVTR